MVPELLAERVGRHQLAQLADDGGVAAEAQIGVDAVLGGDEAPLLEAGRVPPGEVEVRELEQRRAPPQPQRLLEQLAGARGVARQQRGAALLGQRLEPPGVEGVRRDRSL